MSEFNYFIGINKKIKFKLKNLSLIENLNHQLFIIPLFL